MKKSVSAPLEHDLELVAHDSMQNNAQLVLEFDSDSKERMYENPQSYLFFQPDHPFGSQGTAVLSRSIQGVCIISM